MNANANLQVASHKSKLKLVYVTYINFKLANVTATTSKVRQEKENKFSLSRSFSN